METQGMRVITAEDLYLFQLITDCQVSPDGKQVVYCVQWIDEHTEARHSNLWVVPAKGVEPRRFTHGDHADSQPRWSPDGSQIAFLSNRIDEEQLQIYTIPLSGGEARQLTRLRGQFATSGRLPDGRQLGTLAWSPDGSRLLCLFRKSDDETVQSQEGVVQAESSIVARHMRRVFYKSEGTGYLPAERWHIWLIDAGTGNATQLTDSEVHDEATPCWSPDGREIVFCSNRSGDPDLDPHAVDLYAILADGGGMRRFRTPYGKKHSPRFSPDGRWIAYVGREGRGDWWKNDSLWIVPAHGNGEARNLTGGYDLHVASFTIDDMCSPMFVPPIWSEDSQRLFFQVARHGNIELRSISADGDDMRLEVDDKGAVRTFSFDSTGTKLVYLHSNLQDPGQVWALDRVSQDSYQLTHVNRELLDTLDLGEMEEMWLPGEEDQLMHGWILRPPKFDPEQQYAGILQIHGGPAEQYGNFFYHEFYYLAAHGYVVFFCNPRGSQGYGEAYCRATWGAWGIADYDDLIAWTAFASGQPTVDPNRVGVAGGSYGGYMTNWIIGHTDRFKAAVTMRSVSNLVSMWGNSDVNWTQGEMFGDKRPWEAVESYWDRSPMKYIGQAKTPTLVIHSENDLRCNLEQGEQVYVALKTLGVDTELVVFPGEGHGLARAGRTDRRIARLQHILKWFDRYLEKGV